MAGKGAVALDKVVINIESSIGSTPRSINSLAKSLENLKKSISGGFNNIKKLSEGLKELNKVSAKLPETAKNLKSATKISNALNKLSSISKPSGLTSTINALQKIPKVFRAIDPESLKNVARVSSELSSALSPIANKLQMIGNGFTALSTLARTYGVQITRVGDKTKETTKKLTAAYSGLKTTGKIFSSVGSIGMNTVKGLNKAFDKMGSKIKQIGLSLLGTRTIFTLTRKAVSEYMAMDQELTKTTQNLWRALGAQLAPAIKGVLYLFKQIVRVIYSVIYALTGIDLIARANAKAMDAMGKSAGDALGNLQNFDDLNVVSFDEGSGDVNKIELDRIDLTPIQEIIDWMKKLKDTILQAWETGGWNEVAVVLAEGINEVTDYINPEKIATVLGNGIIGGLQFLRTFITSVNWGELGTKIGDTIRNIPWREIWNEVIKLAKEAFGGFDDFMDNLFNFDKAGEWALGLGAFMKLSDAFSGKGIVNFFTELIEKSDKAIARMGDLKTAFSLLSKNTLTTDSISGITGVSKGILNIMKPLSNVFGLITKGVSSLGLGPVVGIIAAIVVGVMALVQAFKNLYENSEPFRETVDGLIESIKGTLLTVLDTLKGMLMKLWEVLVVVWEEVLKPLFDLLVSIVEPFLEALIEILAVLWKNAIQPLIEGLMNFLAPAFELVMDIVKALMVVIGGVIDVIQWLWTNLLKPIVDFLLDIVVGAIKVIGVIVETVIDFIAGYFEWLVGVFRTGWEILKGGFLAVYKYVKEKFIDPLVSAWGKIKDGWDKMWEGVKKGAKSAINWLLEKVESFINRMIRGINGLSSGLRKIGNKIFDIIGVDVTFDPISEVSLPRLETGTNEVPYEGIYHLHPGEAVVPKKYNPALGGGSNDETNQKLDTLIGIMNNMNFTNVVNIGNKTLYKEQQRYNKMQNDKYGTTVNL